MMTDHERVEALERILYEYAGLFGLTRKGRAYFADQGADEPPRQPSARERRVDPG